MSNIKIFNLLMALTERTEEKKVVWEVTVWSNKYITTMANYSVAISEGEGDYFLSIEEMNGDVIEIVSDRDLREIDYESERRMRNLYSLARRSARGADKAIDDILGLLK
ncbi:hypothetical protein ACOQNP_19950 [Ectopseudomonas khazarica]|uniref:hypothetical protein n=1 Tax=Ectopseudomonas khazarica TaxID=2502979 RepID=UPI003B923029